MGLYSLLRLYNGLQWRDISQAVGLHIRSLNRREVDGRRVPVENIAKILAMTGMTWAEFGALYEQFSQLLDSKGNLLHENYRTRSARRGAGKGKGTKKAPKGSKKGLTP